MKQQTGLMTLSLLLATSAVAGGAGAPVARPAAAPAACKTIAQLVTSDPQFSTLAVAVEAAGLGDTLSSGAFTVFAPTNAAFAKVPSDMLATVLNDPEMLRSVLLYHVVPGKIAAKQVMGLKSARTAQGSTIDVMVSGSTVMINDATITQVNVPACNGVIHVIDTVLLPPMPAPVVEAPAPAPTPAPAEPVAETPAPEPAAEPAPATEPAPAVEAPITSAPFDITQIPVTPLSGATTTETTTTDTATTDTTTTDTTTTDTTVTTDTTTTDTTVTAEAPTPTAECVVGSNTLYDVIVADDRFSTLRDLLSDAGLTETLMSGEYTVFAPTNDAFAAVDPETLAIIASTPDLLKQVLLYHVVPGTITADQLASGEVLKTAEGSDLTPGRNGDNQLVGTATVDVVTASVDAANSQACNGTIFVINQVLLPPNFTLPAPVEEAPAADTATTDATATATTTTTEAPAATATTTTTTDTAAATTTTTTDTTAATTTTTPTATTTPAAPAATATTSTTVAVLLADPRFSTLAGLVQAAGLADTLNSGTYTIFAPTNDAFTKVSPSTLSTLQADVTKLRQVLLYHVVAASIDGTNLASATEYTSAQGGRLAVTRTGTPLITRIGDAAIDTGSALDAGASKIYAIDTVLIPQELR